jgi:acetyltransferase-like isoleucine patch superfamily enzyme
MTATNCLGVVHCGANAMVFNHGKREAIRLGNGVIVDGTLECYEQGQLVVDDFSYIGRSRVFAAASVFIGKGVLISDFCLIFDSNLHPMSASRRYNDNRGMHRGIFPDVYSGIASAPVHISDHVWIGGLCVIGKGVTIGEGAIIGAGSVVVKDVAPYTLVAGNPARVIKEIARD